MAWIHQRENDKKVENFEGMYCLLTLQGVKTLSTICCKELKDSQQPWPQKGWVNLKTKDDSDHGLTSPQFPESDGKQCYVPSSTCLRPQEWHFSLLCFCWQTWSRMSDCVFCLFTFYRYLDQTQPDVQDEGEEGWLCGRMPGRKSDRSWWSRSAPLFFSHSPSLLWVFL